MEKNLKSNMRLLFLASASIALALEIRSSLSHSTEPRSGKPHSTSPQIAPAISTNSGLLLEPPLDLDWLTTAQFEEWMESVGKEKIRKSWDSCVVLLPEHERSDPNGLSHEEIKTYMRLAKNLFDAGKAIPVSDVGLISTQEDVIRRPMLNHISAFENAAARVYLLVQKTSADNDWGYFSIVQDMTRNPPLDYYGSINGDEAVFDGTSCYKCHSSGPLAIHPARSDLVLDAALAAAISERIASQPRSEFYFPEHAQRPETGKQLTLSICTDCHNDDAERGPLYQIHFHPIRVLVDFGYMPPDEQLTSDQLAALKAWLENQE
jgi:hypothetical protein